MTGDELGSSAWRDAVWANAVGSAIALVIRGVGAVFIAVYFGKLQPETDLERRRARNNITATVSAGILIIGLVLPGGLVGRMVGDVAIEALEGRGVVTLRGDARVVARLAIGLPFLVIGFELLLRLQRKYQRHIERHFPTSLSNQVMVSHPLSDAAWINTRLGGIRP